MFLDLLIFALEPVYQPCPLRLLLFTPRIRCRCLLLTHFTIELDLSEAGILSAFDRNLLLWLIWLFFVRILLSFSPFFRNGRLHVLDYLFILDVGRRRGELGFS
jgi:hypothetical protein